MHIGGELSSRQIEGDFVGAFAPTRLTGFGQLAVALRPDGLLAAGQSICRRDVSDRAVQAHLVVMLDEIAGDPARVLQVQRRLGPNRR
jgi:hypothetical protein